MNPPEQDAGPSLAAAREARGLTHAQAAEQLRIATALIAAMEEGRYQDLGPAVFARGHLRKYATLLGLPAEGLLADYDASNARVGESSLIPPASAHTPVRTGKRADRRWLVWLLAALLVVVAAGAGGWLWKTRFAPRPAAPVPLPAPIEEPAPAVGEPAQQPPAAGQPGSTTGQEPKPAATTGGLKLEFSRPCWLEVYDARGERLAYELAEPGAELSVGGQPPWRVVLGDAGAAHVSVHGQPVPIPGKLVARRAATLSIGLDGSIGPAAIVASRD